MSVSLKIPFFKETDIILEEARIMMIYELMKSLKLELVGGAVERVFLTRIHLQIEGPASIFLERILYFYLFSVEGGDGSLMSVKEDIFSS